MENLEVSAEVEPQKKEYYMGMFDLLKGYAIISIILTHAIQLFDSSLNQLAEIPAYFVLLRILRQVVLFNNCCMPVFLILGGFGFRPMPIGKCFKKQAKTLLLPYLYAGIAELFIVFVTKSIAAGAVHISAFKSVFRHALGLFLGLQSNPKPFGLGYTGAGAIWFFAALFLAYCILNVFVNLLNEKWVAAACILTSFAGFLVGQFLQPWFFIAQGMMTVVYLYFGYQICSKQLLLKKHPLWLWILIALGALTSVFFGDFGFAGSRFRFGFAEIVFSMCGAYILMYFAMCIDGLEGKVSESIRTIGKFSLWIVCLHNIEYKCGEWSDFRGLFGEHNLLAFAVIIALKFLLIYLMFRILKAINKKIQKIQKARKKARRNSGKE